MEGARGWESTEDALLLARAEALLAQASDELALVADELGSQEHEVDGLNKLSESLLYKIAEKEVTLDEQEERITMLHREHMDAMHVLKSQALSLAKHAASDAPCEQFGHASAIDLSEQTGQAGSILEQCEKIGEASAILESLAHVGPMDAVLESYEQSGQGDANLKETCSSPHANSLIMARIGMPEAKSTSPEGMAIVLYSAVGKGSSSDPRLDTPAKLVLLCIGVTIFMGLQGPLLSCATEMLDEYY